MFDWLERRIDPFAPFEEGEMPPASVARFTWHRVASRHDRDSDILLLGLGGQF